VVNLATEFETLYYWLVNSMTKFEALIASTYKDMKGNANVKNGMV